MKKRFHVKKRTLLLIAGIVFTRYFCYKQLITKEQEA